MKHILYLPFLTLLFTGCVGTKKYSGFVNEKTIVSADSTQTPDWLTVNFPASAVSGNKFEQVKKHFIPALVYWGWNATIVCEIDPYTSGTYIRKAIYEAADKENLNSILGDRKLVINLQQMPGKIVYENKADVVYVLFFTVSDIRETISPVPSDLQATYGLTQNNELVASGNSTIPNAEQPMKNAWQTRKNFTGQYLYNYKKETERMGTELVKEIIAQHKTEASSYAAE